MAPRSAPLPLPIAALLRQAKRTTDATRKHLFAYFAWEASTRLAVAAAPPADARPLELPSAGSFVAAMPRQAKTLSSPELLEVARLLAEETESPKPGGRTIASEKLLSLLPAYRNRVVGHGAPKPDAWCQRAADVLLAGLGPAWEAGLFWPSAATLVYLERIEVDERGAKRARVYRLSGDVPEIDNVTDLDEAARPRRLYLSLDGRLVTLHPWVLFEELAAGERVLFFNGRKRNKTEYLDYLTGETVVTKTLAGAYAGIDEDVAALFGGPAHMASLGEGQLTSVRGFVPPSSRAEGLSSSKRRPRTLHWLVASVVGLAALTGGTLAYRRHVASPTLPVVSRDGEIQKQFERGLDAFFDADFEAAERSFRDVQAREPKSAWATFGLALTASAQDRYEERFRLVGEAMALVGNASTWDADLIRLVAVGSGGPQKQLEAWKELKPRVASSYLSNILAAQALVVAGSADESEKRFRDAIALEPKRVFGHLALSQALLTLGKTDAALEAIEQALALRPKGLWLLLQRSTVLLARGEAEAARRDLEAALPLGAPIRAVIDYTLVLLGSGAPADEERRKSELERVLGASTTSDDDRLLLLCVQGLALQRGGRLRDGEELVGRLADLAKQKRKPSTLLRCLLWAGMSDVALERWDEAERHIELAKTSFTGAFGMTPEEEKLGRPIVRELWGLVLLGRGKLADAKAELAELEDANRQRQTMRPSSLRVAVAVAEKAELPPLPQKMASLMDRASYANAAARAAEARGDKAAARALLQPLLALAGACAGSTRYVEFPCGAHLVMAYARLAELELEASNKEGARAAVKELRRLWSRPDADLPLVRRLKGLEDQLR